MGLDSCGRNTLIVCGVIALVIGSSVLLGAFMPYTQYNQRAVKTECVTTGQVFGYWCRRGSITQQCFDAMLITNPGQCSSGTYIVVGTFTDKALAEQRISQYQLPYKFTCYYDPSSCSSWRYDLKNAGPALWAGVSFVIIAVLCLFPVIVSAFYNCWKHRKYTALEGDNNEVTKV